MDINEHAPMRKISLRLAVWAALFFITACTAPHPDGRAVDSTSEKETYLCESGVVVVASYPDTDSAVITYRGKVYPLRIAISASGARYVHEQVEWWTKGSGKGSTGSLFRHNSDGSSGDLLELCTAQDTRVER